MNVIGRIETLIGSEHLSPNAFAVKVGICPSNLGKMLAGKQRITDKTLIKISDKFGLNFRWLKCGEGEMLDPPAANPAATNGNNGNGNISDGDTISRLFSLLEAKDRQLEAKDRQLEEKDRQIGKLLQTVLDLSVRVEKLTEQIPV